MLYEDFEFDIHGIVVFNVEDKEDIWGNNCAFLKAGESGFLSF